jgi:hypothetical protein
MYVVSVALVVMASPPSSKRDAEPAAAATLPRNFSEVGEGFLEGGRRG